MKHVNLAHIKVLLAQRLLIVLGVCRDHINGQLGQVHVKCVIQDLIRMQMRQLLALNVVLVFIKMPKDLLIVLFVNLEIIKA